MQPTHPCIKIRIVKCTHPFERGKKWENSYITRIPYFNIIQNIFTKNCSAILLCCLVNEKQIFFFFQFSPLPSSCSFFSFSLSLLLLLFYFMNFCSNLKVLPFVSSGSSFCNNHLEKRKRQEETKLYLRLKKNLKRNLINRKEFKRF